MPKRGSTDAARERRSPPAPPASSPLKELVADAYRVAGHGNSTRRPPRKGKRS